MLRNLGNYQPELLQDDVGNLRLDDQDLPTFEPPRRRTPVHHFLSEKRTQSIVLKPLLFTWVGRGGPLPPMPPIQTYS